MNRPIPQLQHNDFVGSAVFDDAPWKLPIGELLKLDDHAIVGFEFGDVRSGPELTLFVIRDSDADSTAEAVEDQGGTVQCMTYVVDDWNGAFDELLDRYFGGVRIRVWYDMLLDGRDVEIIGEQA